MVISGSTSSVIVVILYVTLPVLLIMFAIDTFHVFHRECDYSYCCYYR